MANRVTFVDVRTIYRLADDMDDDEVTAAIDTANLLLNTQVLGKTGVTEQILKEMEKYLGAHYSVIHREFGGFAKREIDGAEDEYAEQKGTGIASTRYGRVVIDLDPSDTLASMAAGRQKASVRMFPTLPTTTRVGAH